MRIKSAQGDYEVKFVEEPHYNASLIVADKNIKVETSSPRLKVTASEELKTLSGIAEIISHMQQVGITRRNGTVIAVGGGTVQDAVAMACHIYQRGVRWIYYPTTLLAMADSCIGGKCGINFGGSKNLLGAYSAPSEVRICTKFLDTLPQIQKWSGLGECAKLYWVAGWDNSWLKDFALGDKSCWGLAIDECLRIKRQYIEEDEFETGKRIHLSYGHTLAHAIESLPDNNISHGLAVVVGMRFANWVAYCCGIMSETTYDTAHTQLAKFPVKVPDQIDGIMNAIALDKKTAGDTVSMVLSEKPGVMLTYPLSLMRIRTHLNEYLAQQ